MNKQPIEKRNLREDGVLDVHSVFYTIQGEGPFCGTPCVFVRLAGCNLQCPGCDTEYTDPMKRRWIDPLALVHKVQAEFAGTGGRGPRLVVITGGEPFRQNLAPFFNHLVQHGFYVQVESNGTLAPVQHTDNDSWAYNLQSDDREGVYVVCSPKSGKVHIKYHDIACAFKYVMSHDSVDINDGLPIMALHHTVGGRVARPTLIPRHRVYLQPMDHSMEDGQDWLTTDAANQESIKACVTSCLTHGYTLQLQIHKLIGVE